MRFSKNVAKVQPSATLALSAKAKEKKALGMDVIDLSIGQPDFETPKNIEEAAIKAIEDGKVSGYTAATGLPELKTAIIDKVKADYGVTYKPSEVIVTTGAKFALYATFQVLLNEGDEVLIPVPAWVSYVEQVRLSGGVPVSVDSLDGDYKVTVDELEAARTPKTKAVIINSPQNPTGTTYNREDLTQIGNWAVKNDIMIISDDIYSHLMYNGHQFDALINISEDIRKHTVLIHGLSKSYAMTGWRIGYALGDERIIKVMSILAGHATGNPATVSQYAAIEALTGPQESVETMRKAFETRLNTIYPLIQAIPGFEIKEKPAGAFYLFVNIKDAVQSTGFTTTEDFCEELLDQKFVAVIPGRSFGMPDYIRISYAASLEDLKESIDRIQSFVSGKAND
ncbi:aspartate tyrosine aromatic aminotransferase [Agrilactobacillus composti DSM 18527 = JCM 14202]|uniref:Aminotransferase n=1 Tax=Agrilactobacillus composti DSM 18527 = JCM 14202 TaxID=1423734 RepID=X0PW59_9LACO|nr:pyridoxal phosphate-dependent aminotransferase [Agrilactobacillus composti]KRM36485.1 aspartate tyrosine aromatic aminotransferase [Agrilactobacillus composti DSM 18527 = JCM 14202]GAF41801.1 aspartate aminotransferase [Agrilactobacillus composti DSM 18527 = JCM 14202]